MKKLLIITFGLLISFTECTNKVISPSKVELAKQSIEKELIEGLDDPSSYEFDTIYVAYIYTAANQLALIKSKFIKNEERLKLRINNSNSIKEKHDYEKEIIKNQSKVKMLDSLFTNFSNEVLNDTLCTCYYFSFRANNPFGGKVKSKVYFLMSKDNKILNYFQVLKNPKVSYRMTYPILYFEDFGINDFFNSNRYIFGIDPSSPEYGDFYSSSSNNYWHDFKDLINTD